MADRISEIEEQAKVILEWCQQQRLPEEQRDIFELRPRGIGEWSGKGNWEWEEYHPSHGEPNFHVFEYRLRKRPQTHKVTVYWYRNGDGIVRPSLAKLEHQWSGSVLLGTTTDEFTEPQ